MNHSQQEEMYRKYASVVYRYLLSLCHDESLAQDLVQDTFLKAVRKADSWKGQSGFSTWLCSIARNEFRQYLRRHPREAELAENAHREDPMHALSDEQMLKHLHAMEDPFREVLYLRFFGNLSYAKIAGIFGQSENWARVTCYRARQKLREEMEKDER